MNLLQFAQLAIFEMSNLLRNYSLMDYFSGFSLHTFRY